MDRIALLALVVLAPMPAPAEGQRRLVALLFTYAC